MRVLFRETADLRRAGKICKYVKAVNEYVSSG